MEKQKKERRTEMQEMMRKLDIKDICQLQRHQGSHDCSENKPFIGYYRSLRCYQRYIIKKREAALPSRFFIY